MVRSHVHSRSLFQLVYHSCNFSFKVSGFALKLMMPPLKSKQQISYPSQRCSTKKMFLKISQNSQKIPVLKSLFEKSCRLCWSLFFFNKVASLRSAILWKRRLRHWDFHVDFAKILKTPSFTEHLPWLLLFFFFSIWVFFH